jgi:flagellum-specific ATP synthase
MMDFEVEVSQLIGELHAPEQQRSGTLVRLVGMRLETRGLMATLGACCEVVGQFGHRIEAEVVGFNDDTLLLDAIHRTQRHWSRRTRHSAQPLVQREL